MHGDSALNEDLRREANPESPLTGEANLLVMPNIDAANISYNLIKMTGGEGVTIGPILLGGSSSACDDADGDGTSSGQYDCTGCCGVNGTLSFSR